MNSNLNKEKTKRKYRKAKSTAVPPSDHSSSKQSSTLSSSYYYQCSTCHKIFQPEFVEDNDHYLCPECETENEKGMPLKGVLQIFYEYDKLKDKYSTEYVNKKIPGNIFAFLDLLPLKQTVPEVFQNLILPPNSLKKVSDSTQNELLVLDETHNPTFSYKDRASVLVAAKAMELEKHTICAASTGNAASSMSGICATVGLNARIYVPKTIPQEKLIQIKFTVHL